MGSRAGLVTVARRKKKSLPRPCRESNCGRRARSVVTSVVTPIVSTVLTVI